MGQRGVSSRQQKWRRTRGEKVSEGGRRFVLKKIQTKIERFRTSGDDGQMSEGALLPLSSHSALSERTGLSSISVNRLCPSLCIQVSV